MNESTACKTSPDPPRGGLGAILIAEDQPDDARLARRAIDKLQLLNPVVVVPNGAETIAYLLGEGKYHDRGRFPEPVVLLLDLRMPEVDGFGVLRWLVAHKPERGFPVVVLSGSRELRELSEAYRLGAHSFLTKPILAVEFKNLITELKIPVSAAAS